ncbi:MAG: hypothetical protein CME69_11690 [Halobacteriovorax sp.]|nr:hypothetical protein [Halobacteriovorax sp.]|tara:strand:+ start:700 stop:1152 length:453 start_codon:yes stop_codon:yes gene_type:complete
MAKKFKFKLDGLLKVREFKEKRIKVELGEILKDIEQTKANIDKAKLDIEECYKAQEAFLNEPAGASMVQFFPQFIEAKTEDYKAQENILYSLQRKYEEKRRELAEAKGDVKVIENLKEKNKTAFEKSTEKKRQEAIDELMQAKRHREKLL